MTSEEIVIAKHRGGQVLLDTNLLLLLMIGTFQRDLIARFARTKSYTSRDFELLVTIVRLFRTIATTPHILTEVGNLATKLREDLQPVWRLHFAQQTASYFEVYTTSVALMAHPVFLKFGLADAAIYSIDPNTVILTEDFRLSGYLRSQGRPVLNLRDLIQVAKGM